MARRKEDGTLAPAKKGGWDASRMTEEGQKTKIKTGGNTIPDRAFCEDEAENLLPLTEKPDDFPWDVELQWNGYAEELDPDYWEQFRRYHKRKCTGISYVRDARGGYIVDLDHIRLQRPCFANPMLGMMVCAKHGGQLGHVREAAERRLTHAAEKAANALITLTDPRDELENIVEQGVRVKAANSVLDRVGIKAGASIEIEVPGYKRIMEKLFGDDSGDEEE